MAKRFYLSAVVTGGIGLRPAISELGMPYASHALPGSNGAVGLVEADVSPAQHATLIADARITALPFVDAGGAIVGESGTVAQMSAGNRTALETRAEAQNIPTQWATGTTTVRQIMAMFVRRLLLRQHLSDDDWNEGLDTLISAIPAAKKTRARDKLLAIGADPSVILPTDTVRAAIRKVAIQNIQNLRTPYDN